MSHYNAIVLINPRVTPSQMETPVPQSHFLDLCCSPLWRQHYAVPGSETALLALDAVDNILSPYWDGWDFPLPPGSPRCIGYDFYRVGGGWHSQFLAGYDPEKDPRNQEPCPHCRDGASPDKGTSQSSPWLTPTPACKRCGGKGTCIMSPEAWVPMEGANIAAATSLPRGLTPYVIVTPDGVWHENE